jgi:maltose alpha-D-glucosyltransferase / alpha-amylase
MLKIGIRTKALLSLARNQSRRANESGKHSIMLEGYRYRWYGIGGPDYLLRRTDIDQCDNHAV